MADHMLKAIDVLQEYFGETDIMKMLDVKTERDKRDSSHYELSDRTVDMSLFPYRLEGPFDPPIPTPAEIAAARPEEEPEIRLTAETWRMGPYQVKVGLHIGPLQVRQLSQTFDIISSDPILGSREPPLLGTKFDRSNPQGVRRFCKQRRRSTSSQSSTREFQRRR
jgi:hypothetical protein